MVIVTEALSGDEMCESVSSLLTENVVNVSLSQRSCMSNFLKICPVAHQRSARDRDLCPGPSRGLTSLPGSRLPGDFQLIVPAWSRG